MKHKKKNNNSDNSPAKIRKYVDANIQQSPLLLSAE
ncbi:hypothetical protein T12_12476 [Trichinella patagoniensis]|uniref:Uncharacterized protein n=1 Tax=Trichinella patagoniensis TaxID=990121 RepID=A0A0V0YUC0_9BILA|nr:hypothetical protein T12_3801 [Trichinella patagoniensis]KRY03905.1 hypothetical protein T12_4176 [Trichinella patagoniensis]KRY04610.1 hypothetical protein T12_13459 [Trichinella patagoniensis]KRY05088.1 hypothetical protein T12_12476 [Trichinella patagoniensis]